MRYYIHENANFVDCPTCRESVQRDQNKPVQVQLIHNYKVGEEIEMKLFHRHKDSLFPDIQSKSDHFEIPDHQDAHSTYSRYSIFTDISKMRRDEISTLTDLIKNENSEEMINVFSLALDFLKYEPLQGDLEVKKPLVPEKATKKSDRKYQYFCEENQNIFLIPLNVKMFLHEFGDREHFPSRINCKIVEMECKQLTVELRNSNKYMEHLPLGSDVIFVELDLSHILSKDTIKFFSKDLSQKHTGRLKKEKDIKREKEMVEEREQLERDTRIRENNVRIAELELLKDLNLSFPELAEMYQQEAIEIQSNPSTKPTTPTIPINTIKWGTNQLKTKKKEDFPSLGKTAPKSEPKLQGDWGKITPTIKKKK
jgi:hypothetical protein